MDGGGFTSELMGDYDGPATMELGHAGDTRYVERRDSRHAYGGSEECVDSHADRYSEVHTSDDRRSSPVVDQPQTETESSTRKRRGSDAAPTSSPAQAGAAPSTAENSQGGRGGRSRQAPRPEGTTKKHVPLSLEERIMLARICGEDDALMADASGVHKHKTKQGRFQWISDSMRDENFFRTSEDCRKKWNSMRDTVALIRDKCERSGSAGYFNMTTEERKEREVCSTFERPLWDAMEWWCLKASATCDNTLASEELGGSGSGQACGGGSEGRCTDASNGRRKTRRTSSGRARSEATTSNVGMMTAMEDSTTRLNDGLDRASSAFARATTESAAMVSSRMGDMAVQIDAVAGAMQDGNMVLQSLVAVMAARSAPSMPHPGGGVETDPSSK
ncbi:hypothetical protein CBR_g24331 [Chara braunii]|uniref:Myb/SANT-like DNA-binding domain-containing protein n=1 Tax=Chara braunii TaxID=69332 RepID=A0A388JMQ1_CHABU|nr:hypothetical protein CBR_g24331 [Chara braunii]|eukprot:GBG58982.1 hypothetical protein CBR_g24331 [Chara braunii]